MVEIKLKSELVREVKGKGNGESICVCLCDLNCRRRRIFFYEKQKTIEK